MRYVIIGGAGFLGLELVRQLQEKNAFRRCEKYGVF